VGGGVIYDVSADLTSVRVGVRLLKNHPWIPLSSNRVLPRNAVALPWRRMLEEGSEVNVLRFEVVYMMHGATVIMVRRLSGGITRLGLRLGNGEEVVHDLRDGDSEPLVVPAFYTRRRLDVDDPNFLQQFLMESKTQSVRGWSTCILT
jgi:hypothetical protein